MTSPATRIYLVGAHSTGKTTLARWIRDRYGLPMISEVARGVLAEMEAQLDSIRSNLDVVNRYQAQVFERQLEAEASFEGPFVSDRAFCNLAYAAHHSLILSDLVSDPRLSAYMEQVKRGVVFFLRPHRELLSDDGVRAGVAWEEVVRIDGMVKMMLEMFAVPYIPVASLSMQERVRNVESVLSLAGVPQVELEEGRRRRELPRPIAAFEQARPEPRGGVPVNGLHGAQNGASNASCRAGERRGNGQRVDSAARG